MLFDLLPHFVRLMPMADKYLSTRSASDKAQEAALTALAGEMRGELGKVGEANAGLSRQVQEQGTQIAELGVDVTRARMGVESVEARVAKLEKTAGTAMRLLGIAVAMLAFALVLLGILVVRGMR
jgi:cobalamin biosynthesis Mg chelatase CobN